VDILARHKILQRLDIIPGYFQSLANVKDQVALPLRQCYVGIDKFDDLDNQHELLLHGERLVDLAHDLHDPRPIVHELAGIDVKGAEFLDGFRSVRGGEFIKQVEVDLDGIPVEVMAKELFYIVALIIGNALPGNNSKKLNDGFE